MPSATITIAHPGTDEHVPYYSRYIDLVRGDDALPPLRAQLADTLRLFAGLGEERALHRYATGKWSVKQVVGHLSDCERVFSYRALRVGRGDATPLPGFDEQTYAVAGGFDARPLAELVDELRSVRAATIALFAGLDPEALMRHGTANDSPITPRALAWIIVGHELHHRALLRERYGLGA